MAQGMHLIWMTFCVQLICISSLQTDHGVSKGRLQLTDGSGQKMSHAFSKNPFEFKSHRSLSFSTKLVCALVSKPGSICGHAKAIILQVIVVQTIITYLALAAVYVYVRRKYAKEREEWEKEYDAVPRRLTYKSLYEEATKGFNKDRNDKRKKKKTKTKN